MSYEELRLQYKPDRIRWLLVAESPPPGAEAQGSRHFYRSQPVRQDDRLFTNTIKALYIEAAEAVESELEDAKESWLQRLKHDNVYMIEALEVSQRHEVTKKQRRERITEALPRLIQRIGELVDQDTVIILIKSNVFDVAAEPLRQAGFKVLNTELVDYPGQFNQSAYRQKLRRFMVEDGWSSAEV